MHTEINIAKEYTRFPGGRYPEDGAGNGTDFREKYLLPVIKDHRHATIILDGAAGYPSSFLDEAFAGLVRNHGFTPKQVLEAFTFVAEKPSYMQFVEMIKQYVSAAQAVKH